MKREIDWFGLWYKILKERGENDCPTFGKLDLETNEVEWQHFSHSDMDGIGALKKYYDSHNFKLTNLPELREKKVPNILERILIFYKMIQIKKIKTNWIFFNSLARPSNPHLISWKVFSPSETSLLKEYCKKNKFSENAFLMNITSKVLLKELSKNGEGTWTVPVNLRPVLKRMDYNSNHSSGILIPIALLDSVATTHEKLKLALKNKQHWAIWWLHQIGKLIGMRGMRFISKQNSEKNYLAGTFSNLGKWELPPNHTWIGSPPGSKNFPIGVMLFTAQERLAFSLKIHPSILRDESSTQVLLNQLISAILELVLKAK